MSHHHSPTMDGLKMPQATIPATSLWALGVTAALTLLATILLPVRIWARYVTGARVGVDEWLVLGSLVGAYGTLALTVLAVTKGAMGQTLVMAFLWSSTSAFDLLYYVFIFQFTYLVSSQLVKLAVLFFYWRTLPSNLTRRGVKVLVAMCALWSVAALILGIIQCEPVRFFWLRDNGYCRFDSSLYAVGIAVPNTVIDIAIAILPLRDILNLRLGFWRKVGVLVILCIGGVSCVASIIRVATEVQFYYRYLNFDAVQDVTHDLLVPWLASAIEVVVAIIGSCLPFVFPIYRHLRYGKAVTSISTSGHRRSAPPQRQSDVALLTIGGLSSRRMTRRPSGHDGLYESLQSLSPGLEENDDEMTLRGVDDNHDRSCSEGPAIKPAVLRPKSPDPEIGVVQ